MAVVDRLEVPMKRPLAVFAAAIAVLTPGLVASTPAAAAALPKIQSNGFGNWHRAGKCARTRLSSGPATS
jgi:UPF0716 family protein affecting phage T7 exclusion